MFFYFPFLSIIYKKRFGSIKLCSFNERTPGICNKVWFKKNSQPRSELYTMLAWPMVTSRLNTLVLLWVLILLLMKHSQPSSRSTALSGLSYDGRIPIKNCQRQCGSLAKLLSLILVLEVTWINVKWDFLEIMETVLAKLIELSKLFEQVKNRMNKLALQRLVSSWIVGLDFRLTKQPSVEWSTFALTNNIAFKPTKDRNRRKRLGGYDNRYVI